MGRSTKWTNPQDESTVQEIEAKQRGLRFRQPHISGNLRAAETSLMKCFNLLTIRVPVQF